jgi:hypothetical protein
MMNDPLGPGQASVAGLCASCANVRVVTNARGSAFYLCQLSFTDPRFPRYPALPVLACDGYKPAAAPGVEAPDPAL